MKLLASILAADFSRLGEQTREAIQAGADGVHLDIMDGHFVPNLTMGPLIAEALHPVAEETGAWMDVHLMVEHPEVYLEAFAKAGTQSLAVHVEACRHLHRVVQQIHALGMQAGVALNPATPLVLLEEILPELEYVLVMSVNPGFAGQAFIPQSLDKIRRLRRMIQEQGAATCIAVDGGIKPHNVGEVVQAGAEVIVAASAIFSGDIRQNVQTLRRAAFPQI